LPVSCLLVALTGTLHAHGAPAAAAAEPSDYGVRLAASALQPRAQPVYEADNPARAHSR